MSSTNKTSSDHPKFFALFSPGTATALAEILLMIFNTASTLGHLFNRFNPPVESGMLAGAIATLVVCALNAAIFLGRWQFATNALQLMALIYSISAIAFFQASSLLVAIFSITALMAPVFALIILRSDTFLLFSYHRFKMAQWKHQRLKRNKELIDKIKRSNQPKKNTT